MNPFVATVRCLTLLVLLGSALSAHETHRSKKSLQDLKSAVGTWVKDTEGTYGTPAGPPGLTVNPVPHDDLLMHPWMAFQALLRWERKYGIRIPAKVKSEIIYGSIEEDWDLEGTSGFPEYSEMKNDSPTYSEFDRIGNMLIEERCLCHFLNENINNQELKAIYLNVNKIFNNFDANTHALKGGWNNIIGPSNSKNWNNFINENPMNKNNEIHSLGHYLHLLADMTVPAHVRHDPHPHSDFDFYEYEFLLTKTKQTSEFDEKLKIFKKNNNIDNNLDVPWIDLKEDGSEPETIFSELAKWTRNSFYSNDTINYTNVHGIELLNIEKTIENEFYKTIISNNAFEQMNNKSYEIAWKNGFFSHWTVHQDNVLNNIFGLTVPKYIQSAAAVVDLYFKKACKATVEGKLNLPAGRTVRVFFNEIAPNLSSTRTYIPVAADGTYSLAGASLVPGRTYGFGWEATSSSPTTGAGPIASLPVTFESTFTLPTVTVSAPLTFTGLTPPTVNADSVGYQATLAATGSSFLNLASITFVQTGVVSFSKTWTKGDADWNAKVAIASDSALTLRPVVVAAGDPAGNSTWTVTLRDSAGAVAAKTFNLIYGPSGSPTISSFTANPAALTAGQASTLAWSVTGATSLSIDHGIGTVTGTSSKGVSPLSTTTYTLTASNGAGSRTATATVTVNPALPVITTHPASLTVGEGESATFTVVAAGTAPFSYQWMRDGTDIPGGTPVTYTVAAASLADSGSRYSVKVSNAAGTTTSNSATLTVTAVPPPTISAFTANPATLTAGQSSTLSWSVAGATSLSIDQGIGTVTGTASKVVTPATTTTYTLTARNAAGASTSATATVTVSPIAPAVLKPAAGSLHSLALKSDGTVWGWGHNGEGQLGNGSQTGGGSNPIPSQTKDLQGVVAIAAGHVHSLALRSDGTVWAWGEDVPEFRGPPDPTPVRVSNLTDVIAIAAGGTTWSLALKSDGTVWGWGDNTYGQLGDGTSTYRATPVQVNNLSGVVAIAGGNTFSLALKADGTVWGWGSNAGGQLGDGTAISRNTPVQVNLPGGITAISSSAMNNGPLALRADGTVWTWGWSWGLAGGGSNPRFTPEQVGGLTGIVGIAAADAYYLALKGDGTVWAWGAGESGSLGDGCGVSRNTPVQVAGLGGVAAVAGGEGQSLAVKTDGTVWSWGRNDFGQLGDGTTTNRLSPVQVLNLTPGSPPSAPVIGGFTAIPNSITAGDSTTLAWSVSAGSTLDIDQGIGTVTGTASKVVTPATTTTYTLTARNAAGASTSATATVTVSTSPATPVVLASGLSVSRNICVDSSAIYWAEDDASVPWYQDATTGLLRKVGLSGGAVTQLASGLNHPISLVLDSSDVYFLERGPNVNGTLKKVPLSGGGATLLVGGLYYPQGPFTLAGSVLYWQEPTSQIWSIPTAGGTRTLAYSGSPIWSLEAICADAQSIYWIERNDGDGGYTNVLRRMPLAGGSPTTLATGLGLGSQMVQDASFLYWTEQAGVPYGVPVPGNGKLRRLDKGTGLVSTLAAGLNAAWGIAIDSSSVYWSDSGTWAGGSYSASTGTLKKVPLAGGTITTLATGLDAPAYIALDATTVYWSEGATPGSRMIKKLPK